MSFISIAFCTFKTTIGFKNIKYNDVNNIYFCFKVCSSLICSGDISPGGHMSHDVYVLGGKCPGGKCSGYLYLYIPGVSVWWVYMSGGLCPSRTYA